MVTRSEETLPAHCYFPILLPASLSMPLSVSPTPPSSLPLLSAPPPRFLAWHPEHGRHVRTISSWSLALARWGVWLTVREEALGTHALLSVSL